jgi:hypothetical protein
MAARLLEATGVHMGERLSVTAEDPDFSHLLKDPQPDERIFEELVRKRSSTYKRWGFKAPFRYHWELLVNIRDVRYLVVFRDVLAVANRNKISVDTDVLRGMQANLALEMRIVAFLAKSSRPALLFSYEKAALFPKEVSGAVLGFAGSVASELAVKELCQVIQPNELEYVTTQDPLHLNTTLHVDVLERGRIAGWARCSDGNQVSVRIEINEEPVAETTCSLPRVDLAQRFGGGGRFAFDVRFPTETQFLPGSAVIIKNSQDGHVLFRGAVN